MDVLIIEADDRRAIDIGDYLSAQGDEPDFAFDSRLALRLCSMHRYDAIILDPDPPHLEGGRLCDRLRSQSLTKAPIVVVNDDETRNVLDGCEAHNCIMAPSALPALYARLESAVYRKRRRANEICSASLHLDPEEPVVHCAGEAIVLAPISYKILELLMSWHPGIVPRDEIEKRIWPGSRPASEAALRGHIHRLRQLLAEVGGQALIRTVHGVGYQLADRG